MSGNKYTLDTKGQVIGEFNPDCR